MNIMIYHSGFNKYEIFKNVEYIPRVGEYVTVFSDEIKKYPYPKVDSIVNHLAPYKGKNFENVDCVLFVGHD